MTSGGRRMPGFADRQADRRQRRIGRNVGEPLAQPLERVGLKARKAGIQGDDGTGEAKSIRDRCSRRRVASHADGTCSGSAPRMTDDSVPMAPVARPSWRWRGVAWVATLAGVMALAYVIAHWGWHWLLPRPPAAVVGETADRWAPAILASPLLGRAGASAAAPTATTDEPATLQGDTRLLGVFAASDGTGHALFRLGARGPVLVRSGEEIASDVTLVEVRPDGVRIRDHGEMREPRPSRRRRRRRAASAIRGAPSLACAHAARIQGARLSAKRGVADRHRDAAGRLEGAADTGGRRSCRARRERRGLDARIEARRSRGAGQRHRAHGHRRHPGCVRQAAGREPAGPRRGDSRRQARGLAVPERGRLPG